ncbi:MAG: TlpA family protein disulfide reductase [Betaproteobacteria bacterium]|nr:TlpA family protein disulfide reductase [Betaproteobacteria bacterium]
MSAAQSPGARAPACNLTAWNGDDVSLRDRYRGKIVYVDFWASWCAPCAQSFPFMNALHDEFGSRGLVVLGINVDEKREDAQRFLARHPARFPLAQGADGECASRFGVAAMPTSVLVDGEGNIRHVHPGFRSSDGPVLRERIVRLLNDAGHAAPTSTR